MKKLIIPILSLVMISFAAEAQTEPKCELACKKCKRHLTRKQLDALSDSIEFAHILDEKPLPDGYMIHVKAQTGHEYQLFDNGKKITGVHGQGCQLCKSEAKLND